MANVLFADVESAPIVAHVWQLRDVTVGLNQIVKDPELIGVGYSRNGAKAGYLSTFKEGREGMLQGTWNLLDWAQVVVGWNSTSFDLPWIRGEFAREQMPTPSPYKSLDLMRVCRRAYRFPSFKLDYVAGVLLGEHKLSTGGHELWVRCLEGDPKAQALMSRYCRRDVDLLPPLFEHLKPYFPAAINFALLDGVESLACRTCGKADQLIHRGTAHTSQRSYPQYYCKRCNTWMRDTRSVGSARGTGVS